MKRIVLIALALSALVSSCSTKSEIQTKGLTSAERSLIDTSATTMRVLVVSNEEDSLLLRKECTNFTDSDLKSEAFKTLAEKMVTTVQDSRYDGVGIAGPQVGLSKRVVAVQRFDKHNSPFEVYPNIVIESKSKETQVGREGCLSVPDLRGMVKRSSEIIISYKDTSSLETVKDTIKGFTAVIFQHETDHLNGILYTDKADSVFVK